MQSVWASTIFYKESMGGPSSTAQPSASRRKQRLDGGGRGGQAGTSAWFRSSKAVLMNAMLSCRLQRGWFWTWDTSLSFRSSCSGDSRSLLQARRFWSQLCKLFCIHTNYLPDVQCGTLDLNVQEKELTSSQGSCQSLQAFGLSHCPEQKGTWVTLGSVAAPCHPLHQSPCWDATSCTQTEADFSSPFSISVCRSQST